VTVRTNSGLRLSARSLAEAAQFVLRTPFPAPETIKDPWVSLRLSTKEVLDDAHVHVSVANTGEKGENERLIRDDER
jgi:hypothetical protein